MIQIFKPYNDSYDMNCFSLIWHHRTIRHHNYNLYCGYNAGDYYHIKHLTWMLIIQMSALNKSPHQLSGTLSRCVRLRFANWLCRWFGSRWLDVNHMDVVLHCNSFPCRLLAVWSLAGFDIPLLLHVWCCPTRPPWDGGWLQWWGDALAKQWWSCILTV